MKDEIADLEDLLNSRRRIKSVIISELKGIIKKYGTPRKTDIVYDDEIEEEPEEIQVEDYAVNLFLSREGYFKKITPLSLRMGGEQKYKENDGPFMAIETTNRNELLFFTDKCQVYKTRVFDFDDTKASALGSFLPSVLGMDPGETPVYMMVAGNYTGQLIFFFENGKAAKIELSSYATKTNRKKLTGAYSDKSPLRSIVPINGDIDLAAYSTDGRLLIFNSSLIASKSTRNSQGVAVMTLKKKFTLDKAVLLKDASVKNFARYRVKTIPAAGAILKPEDMEEQQMDLFDI